MSEKLVGGALPSVHQVEDAPSGSIGLCSILADIVQGAPDIQCSAHDIDIIG
ncbi:MAG: hypothetical protein KK476_19640 [Sinorhizobium fredii]|nr:hypothetical protein [Sinorhizobium fredii]MCG5477085.1 hypothetical protein [Sinorhizobium fredii]